MKHTRFPILLVVPLLLLTACAPAAIPAAPTPEPATEYPEDTLLYAAKNGCGFDIGCDAGAGYGLSAAIFTYGNIIARYPDAKMSVQENGEGFYLVYSTDLGNRLYLFFNGEKSHDTYLSGYPILMHKALSYEAFDSVKPGSTLSEIGEIDAVTTRYSVIFAICREIREVREANHISWSVPYFVTMHLLTDGILQIEYEYDTEREEFFVTKTTFSPDFILRELTGRPATKSSRRIMLRDKLRAGRTPPPFLGAGWFLS
ncbi:MAG: hypothetical protein PHD67_11020 [Oscillospiraceae bacterium]|nr:hypothetical protein [Oscillospiraceae bacterium]